jgi:triosephosphate isomerase
MNPEGVAEAKRIIKQTRRTVALLTKTDVVLCPSYIHMPLVLSAKTKVPVELGAQDVSEKDGGSFTGEISATMLRDLGTSFVIVGHSERRAAGESDELVAKKARAVVDAGMTAIVCVGEKIHDAQGAYLNPLRDQIRSALSQVSKKYAKYVVVAYEPIWAIGAKEAMDPGVVQEMTIFIRKVLSDLYGQEEASVVRVLYGGSVNFRNAGDIVAKGGVDGLLVGRESVNSAGFVELLKTVDGL